MNYGGFRLIEYVCVLEKKLSRTRLKIYEI